MGALEVMSGSPSACDTEDGTGPLAQRGRSSSPGVLRSPGGPREHQVTYSAPEPPPASPTGTQVLQRPSLRLPRTVNTNAHAPAGSENNQASHSDAASSPYPGGAVPPQFP